ncbi:hypothetical protein HBH98_182570 [Parastagonospora nodorum]|nr:hypothetical protein HBH98_182570 [Parastagonospora nodorum]KAH5084496.1 hypothetical protein HBI73_155600 [Parastagonospora nodorum]KAH5089206.1 hypothetical protein HBH72_232960 [Parastagonospora nodorum]KAH5099194.1 hypothetical protein HBH71_236140 [Parastagonospora nodorum]KAH5396035.1 hypothetical protein HBI47_228290 [Parastagonospora nodorum]
MEQALVNKGTKGELYAQLLLTLSRDVRREAFSQLSGFLIDLFGTKHTSEIVFAAASSEFPQLAGSMNFLQFTKMPLSLDEDNTPWMLYESSRRNVDCQLAGTQQWSDLAIPVYWGKVDEPFKKDQCGLLVVQVKAQKKDTKTDYFIPAGFNRMTEVPRQSRKRSTKSVPDLFKNLKTLTILLILNLCAETSKKNETSA